MHRFDRLQDSLGVSRKVLTERLKALVEGGVLEKRLYNARPPRYEYHLTASGRGLLPVLMSLQDWGSRFVMGDGTLSATTEPDSAEAHRVHALVGTMVPEVTVIRTDGSATDPVGATPWTVLYCFPGAYAPADNGYPPGWLSIPGTRGCTLESCTYRDRLDDFAVRGASVVGVSTQRPDQLSVLWDRTSRSVPTFPCSRGAGLHRNSAGQRPFERAHGCKIVSSRAIPCRALHGNASRQARR